MTKNQWHAAGLLAVALLLAVGAASRADLPGARLFRPTDARFQPVGRPIPVQPRNAVPIRLEVSDTASRTTLIVPRNLLGQAKKVARLGSATTPEQAAATAWFPLAILTLGFGLSGLLLVRGRWRWGIPGLLLALILYGAASRVWANPPAASISAPRPLVDPPFPLKDVLVETAEKGDCIRLVLPRTVAKDLVDRCLNR